MFVVVVFNLAGCQVGPLSHQTMLRRFVIVIVCPVTPLVFFRRSHGVIVVVIVVMPMVQISVFAFRWRRFHCKGLITSVLASAHSSADCLDKVFGVGNICAAITGIFHRLSVSPRFGGRSIVALVVIIGMVEIVFVFVWRGRNSVGSRRRSILQPVFPPLPLHGCSNSLVTLSS